LSTKSSSPFKARFNSDSDQVATWGGLHGSSLALALLSAARAHRGITLVLARSSHQSQLLARDLQLLSVSPLPVLQFPDHETLPYDPFSPHPDIIPATGYRAGPDIFTGSAITAC